MPGPGGGSHGGGFGGGSRGGGFGGGHGGGFGGGHFGGPHRPHRHYGYRGPFFFGGWYPRPYYYGGGCLGGLLGAIMFPIIILLVFILALFGSFMTSISNIANGGSVDYDERTMQIYGNERYAEAFGELDSYEENILIVFLVNEEYDGYYVYACVGNDLDMNVQNLYGNEYTQFGVTVLNAVPDYYEFSLSANLASIMKTMAVKTVAAGATPEDAEYGDVSYLMNNSSLAINEQTVNKALLEFTEKTGIPAVIAVDDMEDVFGKSIKGDDVMIILIMLGLLGFIGFVVFRAVMAKKNGGNQNGTGNGRKDDYFDENYRF